MSFTLRPEIAILCCLLLGNASAQVSFRLVSEMEKVDTGEHWNIQGWQDSDVTYYDVAEAATNFPSALDAGVQSSMTVPLHSVMPAGTYDLHVALATQNTNMSIALTVNGVDLTNREISAVNDWTNFCRFESETAFSNLTLTVTKLRPAGLSQKYWFAGVGVASNCWARVNDGDYWRLANFTPITERETNSVSTGNFVPNSSFEFGLDAYGWTSGRNGNATNEAWMSNMTTNDAYDGSLAAVFKGGGMGGARYRIYSPPIWIRGDRKERQYSLSFYYKQLAAADSFTFRWQMVFLVNNEWYTNTASTATISTTSEWQRFSTNVWLKPLPSRLLLLSWYAGGIDDTTAFAIDGVQVEEGSTASDYAPADAIECNLTLGRNGNILDVSESRTVTVEFYNSTASASNVVYHYEAYDWMNRLVATGTSNHTATAGYSTATLTLGTTNNGTTRMYAWVDGSPMTRSEFVFSVVPLPASPSLETNSLFGTHGLINRSFVESNYLWGLTWHRAMNPAAVVTWDAVEATEGDFSWTIIDTRVNEFTNAAIIFGSLSTTADFPAWAVTNGVPRLDVWSNFVYQAVARYKDRIWYWEDINEPAPTWTAPVYATILEMTVGAVNTADTNAYFVAFGGAGGSYYGTANAATWISNVWDALSPTTQAKIDAVAIHIYPDTLQTQIETAMQLGEHTGLPVWNTESGVWQWGNYKGDRCGGLDGLTPYAGHWVEYQNRRSVWPQISVQMRNVLRCLGRGMGKFFYYMGNLSGYHWYDEDPQTTLFNYDDPLNSVGAAYLWAKYFVDFPTNVSSPTNAEGNCLAFLFERASSATLAVWVDDQTQSNYVAVVTNSGFAVYDLHGNLIQTNLDAVWIGRIPTYWVSTALTGEQLFDTFTYATISSEADTNGAAVSIDVTAHGRSDVRQLPLRFRWTAIDNWRDNSDDYPTNVATRYRFSGLSEWSEYGDDRYVEMASLPTVATALEVQALDADGNESSVMTGPSFGSSSGITWYVSPTGTGNGTLGNPGGLSNAVVHVGWAASIAGGDTVYLRGGTYAQGTNFWIVGFDGAVGNLVTWRAYTGEYPKVDGPWRFGSNKHHRFWGIEFYDSHKNDWEGLTNPWLHFDDAGAVGGSNEWVNCIIHDVHNCFSGTTGGHSIRGCIFWYVGQTLAEHVVYPYSREVRGNIGAWTSGEFIETGIDGMILRSNILFGEGWTISNESGSEIVIGFPYNATVEHNSIYDQVYWTAGLRVNTADSVVVSNVIAGPYLPFMEGPAWGLISYPNNTVCSYEFYNTNTLDLVRVYKNDDEAKRAHVAVFNWASNNVVAVSLAGVLVAGDTYQLISAQNYAAGAIQTGTYNGISISVPMTNLTVAPVLYGTNVQGQLTSPRFAAFVVLGASGGGGSGGIALPLK